MRRIQDTKAQRGETSLVRWEASFAYIVVMALGCSSGSLPDADPPADAGPGQAQWEAADLRDYRFDFQLQCFCVREQVQPVTIEVRDGEIVRVVSRETGQELDASEGLRWYTVADLFRVISDARRHGVTPLTVAYHPQLGYPTQIEAGSLAADAGAVYSASNLQPVTR